MLETLEKGIKNFFNFLKPRNKFGVVSFIFLGTFAVFCLLVFAAPAQADVVADALASLFANIVLFFAGLFMQLAIFFLKFVISVASYNGYIDSTPVMLGWTLVRDIGNMFFVIILLVIAFATVLGVENYSWKKLLMKFVLAAILVNFSRVICGVIIDAAQVFMMTFINGVAATAGGNLIQALNLDKILSWSKDADPNDIKNYTVIGTAMAASFFAALSAFIVGAYLVLLVVRAVVLWVLIILSPLAFVLNVIPKTQAYAGKWWNTFGNEVVAGPVLVFFLWLSFAVAGNGELHKEMDNQSQYSLSGAISDINAETESVSNKNLSAGGLGEVLEWENMASFIISAALMLVGVKVTKELGTIGGGMMGGIVDFGKKAATVASGVAAARYLATGARDRVLGAGKAIGGGVLMNMPLGGKYWQNLGMGIKGRTLGTLEKMGTARDAWVSGWEKEKGYGTKGTAASRAFYRTAGRVLQTNARARKRAEGWTEGAERLQKVHDIYMSTSATPGGKFKDEATTQMVQAEDFKGVKTAQKAAAARLAWNESELGKSREDMIKSTAIKGEALKAEVEGLKEKDISALREREMEKFQPKTPEEVEKMTQKEREKYEASYGATMQRAAGYGAEKKISDLVSEGRKVLRERDAMDQYKVTEAGKNEIRKIPGIKAEGEYRTMVSDRSTEVAVAKAKDDYLEQQTGFRGNYERQVNAKHTKEDTERISAGSFDRALAQAAVLGSRLNKDSKNYAGDENIDLIKKTGSDMLLSNFQRGAVFGLNAMDNFFDNSGLTRYSVTAESSKENVVNQQANLATALLGEQVENTPEKVKEAFNKLGTVKGEAFMESLSSAVGEVANDASTTYAGLLKEVRNPKDNSVKVLPLSFDEQKADIEGKREYAMTKSRYGNEGLAGSIDNVINKETGKNEVRITSEQAKKNIGSMFEAVTGNNYLQVNKNAINDLASAVINAKSGDEIKGIVEALAKGINDERGYKFMLAGIKKSLDAKGSSIELPEVEHKIYHQKAAEKTEETAGSAGGKRSAPENKRDDMIFENIATKFAKALEGASAKIASTLGEELKKNIDQIRGGQKLDIDGITKALLKNVKASGEGNLDEEKLSLAIGGAIKEALSEQSRVERRRKQAEEAKEEKGTNN